VFCNFVRNRISVTEIEMLGPALKASDQYSCLSFDSNYRNLAEDHGLKPVGIYLLIC
jgi:hypothetical protein